MAEQRILGYTTGQTLLEGVNVIDALANIAAAAEEVLVDVEDGVAVRSKPISPAKMRLKTQIVGAGRCDLCAAGCDHPVATHHPPGLRIGLGTVSGWARTPISRWAPSRPRMVSASSVITYLTRRRCSIWPMVEVIEVSVAPRSQRFNSWSFPRLRSSQSSALPARSNVAPGGTGKKAHLTRRIRRQIHRCTVR